MKIFTARVSRPNHYEALRAIQLWSKEHIGTILEVTCVKDYGMVMLYDDRCTQVIQNAGILVELLL